MCASSITALLRVKICGPAVGEVLALRGGLTENRGAAVGGVVVGVAAEDAVAVVEAVVEAKAVGVLGDEVAVGAREILTPRSGSLRGWVLK